MGIETLTSHVASERSSTELPSSTTHQIKCDKLSHADPITDKQEENRICYIYIYIYVCMYVCVSILQIGKYKKRIYYINWIGSSLSFEVTLIVLILNPHGKAQQMPN